MREFQWRTLSAVVLAIGIASGVIANFTLTPAEVDAGRRSTVLIMNMAYWGSWALLIPIAVFLAWRIRARNWPWPAALVAHALVGAFLAMTHLAVLSTANQVLVWATLGYPMTWRRFAVSITSTPRLAVEWEFTMYAALAALAYAMALQAEVRRRAVSEAQLETSLAQARLLALQRQLQPHFLFNTLHAVSSLLRRDPDAAESMIERLGRLLRTTLRDSAANEVTLAQDLAALEDYLAIESVQMRERLNVTFAIDAVALEASVPVLLLQPLVENSVRHGLQPRARGGSVHVSARRIGEDLCLQVRDDGIGLTPREPHSAGVGLANTRGRLEQLYGTRQSFEIAEPSSGGVTVSVTLPFRVPTRVEATA
ncbi:MAG: histidine kinase [Acidobacteria bacterium]|jgi:glucose-6-phosphate-specific signal transduction histidine kinase|nr:histidine kinase [Acidobacteriota bacterium]